MTRRASPRLPQPRRKPPAATAAGGKRFRVVVRRDAWVNYFADIDAPTAAAAADIARDAWKMGSDTIKFEEDGLSEFDEILVDPDDCEEVDAEGNPLP